ncbi:clavaminate synthase-like protein At3g21360 [Cryptomeria japonica]|uniref:clavaminate synthase-like protein At3g21360 n=1 Tax=Cryptomeria japonica TaxID=3369 RepID=UPI0027D9FDDA|nr:clavaminate synthase-like protein At3g21360 [Cryptomeria japonica]
MKSGIKVSRVSWDGNKMILMLKPIVSIRTIDGDKKTWFNSLTLSGSGLPPLLGDRSVVPTEVIESCLQIAEEEAVDLKWEAGDVVVLDNRFVMHARRPSVPPRRILAAFCK